MPTRSAQHVDIKKKAPCAGAFCLSGHYGKQLLAGRAERALFLRAHTALASGSQVRVKAAEGNLVLGPESGGIAKAVDELLAQVFIELGRDRPLIEHHHKP